MKHFTLNVYAIFDTTPEIYAALYDMSEAGGSTNVVAGMKQVKQLKPSFKVLRYYNLRTSYNQGYLATIWSACVANKWLLKDSAGNYVADDVGYLVDIGNPSFQTYIANFLKANIESYGYDGLFADWGLQYGTGDFFYLAKSTPINPRTAKAWTDSEVTNALISLHSTVKSVFGPKLLCGNGIFNGYKFFAHQTVYQQILNGALDGIMAESPFYAVNQQWMTETDWKKSVDFLTWIQDNWLIDDPNRFLVFALKIFRGSGAAIALPPGATAEQMATFAFCSILLGIRRDTEDQVYFSTFGPTSFVTQTVKPLYDARAKLGDPAGEYYQEADGVYSRLFGGGKVTVDLNTHTGILKVIEVIPPEPEPPKTLAARSIGPFGVPESMLRQLWKLREKWIRPEVHRKLHPLV